MRTASFRGSTLAVLTAAVFTGIAAGTAHAEPVPGYQQIDDSTAWTVSTTATSATFTLAPPSRNTCVTMLYKSSAADAQALLDWWKQNPEATPEEQEAKVTELGIETIQPIEVVGEEATYRYPLFAVAEDLKSDPDYQWDLKLDAWGSLVEWGAVAVDEYTATLDLDAGTYLLNAVCVPVDKIESAPGVFIFEPNEESGQLHVKEFVVGQTTPEPEPEPEKPGLFEGLFGSFG